MSTLPPLFSLAGRRALVTGSSRGIGASIALCLAEAGADVMIHYVGDDPAAHEVSGRIAALGRRTGVVQADFADPGAARKVFDATADALGGIDILTCNVAVQIPEPWSAVTRDHFDAQVAINLRCGFELIQLAAPAMLERGWGRIVTVGSVQELKPHPQMVVYSAMKGAQAVMVKTLARQFAAQGVTVNNLAPGVILTDRNIHRLADAAYSSEVRAMIPAKRFGEPGDCCGAALLLCSEAGRYITGQSIRVDGGMSLG